MRDKQSLLAEIIPKAVLKATTDEAKQAIGKNCLGEDMIGIWQFPFRIGRESRVTYVEGELVVSERRKLRDDSKPNNDIYLVDGGELLNISRQHLKIEKDENGYSVVDRRSACGTVVNDHAFGGRDEGGSCTLKDGDVVKIGGQNSPYLFEFISLEEV